MIKKEKSANENINEGAGDETNIALPLASRSSVDIPLPTPDLYKRGH